MPLASERQRQFTGPVTKTTKYAVKASTKVIAGQFLGNSTGARGLVAADPFIGIALETVDNSTGALGDKYVSVALEGIIKVNTLPTGTVDLSDIGNALFASADDTLTESSTGNSSFGKVVNVIGSTAEVSFKATGV
jgi:hypothetical protein